MNKTVQQNLKIFCNTDLENGTSSLIFKTNQEHLIQWHVLNPIDEQSE